MNSDEYLKLKEVFQSVLDLSADERAAYLDEHCADKKVRVEVERLIASYDSTYLEQPAVHAFSNDVLSNGSRLGERIGHYTIVEKIGSGGMGEVYLAEDGKLGRHVAIKLISEIFTGDVERVNRFQLEARAVSALNHPNILTIFEIGETETTHYIATEYIDGETLRSKLNRGKLPANEALDIAVQCASALAAAHENGIIHRDIKPENIMLRRDNLVKLLDFGLAKLVDLARFFAMITRTYGYGRQARSGHSEEEAPETVSVIGRGRRSCWGRFRLGFPARARRAVGRVFVALPWYRQARDHHA